MELAGDDPPENAKSLTYQAMSPRAESVWHSVEASRTGSYRKQGKEDWIRAHLLRDELDPLFRED